MNNKVKGFTAIEMLLVVVIVGILAAVATPGITSFMDKQKVVDAAEAIYSQVAYARSESVARSLMVYVRVFVDTSDVNGTTWAVGVSSAIDCNTAVTDPDAAGACILTVAGQNVLKRIVSTDYPGVSLATTQGQIGFDPVRGTTGNAGTLTLSFKNRDLFVIVSPIGRVKVCTDPDNNPVGGYSKCS